MHGETDLYRQISTAQFEMPHLLPLRENRVVTVTVPASAGKLKLRLARRRISLALLLYVSAMHDVRSRA